MISRVSCFSSHVQLIYVPAENLLRLKPSHFPAKVVKITLDDIMPGTMPRSRSPIITTAKGIASPRLLSPLADYSGEYELAAGAGSFSNKGMLTYLLEKGLINFTRNFSSEIQLSAASAAARGKAKQSLESTLSKSVAKKTAE